MKRTWLYSSLFLGALTGPLVVGCSSEESSADSDADKVESSLEIFSWWTSSGEAQALQTLIDELHDRHPNLQITNAAAENSDTARATLAERLGNGEPPDSFQAVSGRDILGYVNDGKMEDLDDLAKKNGWNEAFPPQVLDILRGEDGKLYAIPANIERDNNLYYGVKVLADNGIDAPETLPDFYAACATLQAADVTPLSVPAAGWVLALVAFETLMPAVNGGEWYTNFLSGKADPNVAANEAEARKLFEELAKVLACSDVATSDPRWTASADEVVSGNAAMYVMGDWGKGYFEGTEDADGNTRAKFNAGEDFGVVPGLGSKGYFTFNSAVFGLPKGAQHPNAAKAFLEVVGSIEGQSAFNPIKGSVPARSGVGLDAFDDMVRGAYEDFVAAGKEEFKLLPGYASLTTQDFQTEINPSLLVFAVGGEHARELDPANVPESEAAIPAFDVDYMVTKLQANYGLLAN